MKFEAILFDLDGTLLNTLTDLADSANAALARLGFAAHPVEAYRYFIGKGMDGLVAQIVPQANRDDSTLGKCLALAKEEYAKRWHCTTEPSPGVLKLLARLEALEIPKAIYSNKPDEFTKLIVDRMLGDFNFKTVRGATPSTPKKPDPAAALQIAAELDIAPDKFLYLGDSNTDMQTANAAGMYAAGALWGFREAEELLASGAKVLVEEPLDVLDVLGVGR